MPPNDDPRGPTSGDAVLPGDAVEGTPRGAALGAFDTLRRIARAADPVSVRGLLASVRQAIFAGDEAGIPWIVAAQQLEHEGEISRGAASYLIASFAEDTTVATWEGDPEMGSIGRRIDEIERARGLKPGQYWRLGEGPPEWQAAERQWEEAFDRRWQALLRRVGEHELAELLESDRDEFDRRVHAGESDLRHGTEGTA